METFSRLLHEQSSTKYDPDFTESDPATWPAEWRTTYYKEYSRFPATPLPVPPLDMKLSEAIAARKSERSFSGNGLTLDQLGPLLKYSCGEFQPQTGQMQGGYRAQPSGGARFPIEMYVLLMRSQSPELKPGVYHYNVRNHTLEWMWEGGAMFQNPSYLMKSDWTHNTEALFVMTGVFWRSQNKYQARGYRMICIEAGAIIQNLYLAATALGLKCTAFSGTNDDKIEELLDLDTEVESLVMSTLIGT